MWLCDVEAKENWASVSRVIIPTSNVHGWLKCAREGERGEKYISSKWETRTALRLKVSPHMFILCVWRHAPTGFNGGKWRQQTQCKIRCVNWCVEGVDENMEIQGDDSGMSNTVGWDHGISMCKKLASPIEQRNSFDFLPACYCLFLLDLLWNLNLVVNVAMAKDKFSYMDTPKMKNSIRMEDLQQRIST